MKYVFAALMAISSLAGSVARADACQEIVYNFLRQLDQDKKEELLKLVYPQSQLYTDIKEDRYHVYSVLMQQRLQKYQMIYHDAYRVLPDKSFSQPGTCHMQIFGLEGGERDFIGFAHVKTDIPKILIENFGLGGDL
jgi:hypothetical protein